jgi:hypothetical protein
MKESEFLSVIIITKNPIPKGLNQVFEFKNISMMEYAQHILDKINKYCSKNRNALDGSKNIQDYVNDYDIVTSVEGVGYCISYNRHQKDFLF